MNLTMLENLGVSLVKFEENPAVCQAELFLPEHSAAFKDHFPGRPLLPAIGLISLCEWMIRRWLGDDARLVSLKRVKFTRPVIPGLRLQIQLSRRGADRLRMVAHSSAGDHSSGELGLHLEPAMSDGSSAQEQMIWSGGSEMSRPDPSVLPHGPAFRLVQSVDALGDGHITCSCHIPDLFSWQSEGRMPTYLALEGVAQAAGLLAAHLADSKAMAAGSDAGETHGYVARIRQATFPRHDMDGALSWSAYAELEGRSGHMILCRGEVRQGTDLILQAGLALYI